MKNLFCAFVALTSLSFVPNQPQAQNISQNGVGTGFNSQYVAHGIVEAIRPLKIIEIPDQFVNPNLPPYWIVVCRPIGSASNSNNYVQPIYSNVDRNTNKQINDRGCTYIPFTKSITLSTGAETHEIEYQFLGRS